MTREELRNLIDSKKEEMRVVHNYITELNHLSEEMDETLNQCFEEFEALNYEKYDLDDFNIDFNSPDNIFLKFEMKDQISKLDDMLPSYSIED